MNKQEFLSRLQLALSGLPWEDIEERLAFYGEMIDDRVEDGLTEEAAVAEIGPIEDIVPQILSEIPLQKLVKERIRPKRRLPVWEIVLLILGFPVWFPLLMAAFAVVLSLFIVLWSLIVSLWAVEVSFAAGGLAGLAAGVVLLCQGDAARGLFLMGSGIALAGLSVVLFFGCKAATRGGVILTKKIVLWIKSLFLRKEKEQ